MFKLKKTAAAGLLICISAVILSVFCGCSPISYPFLHDTGTITDIKVVEITSDRDYTTGDFEYDILAEIEDRDSFIEQFKKIKFHRYLIGDPTHLCEGKKGILFFYENGNREYVGYEAQAIVKNDRYGFGKVNCNTAQFDEFIQEWTN